MITSCETESTSTVNVFLNNKFGLITPYKINDLINPFESAVADFAAEQIFHWLKKRLPSLRLGNTFRDLIYQGSRYRVEQGPKIEPGSSTIVFAIMRVEVTKDSVPKPEPMHGKIEPYGVGTYGNMELFVKGLPIDNESLILYLASIFTSSYSWLYEYIRKCFQDMENEASTELYFTARSLLRPHFPEEILSTLLFAVQANGRSQYILDAPTMDCIIKFFAKRKLGAPVSLAKLFMEFVVNSVDFEKSFAKIAIGSRRCIDADLSRSKYIEESSWFQYAEELHFDAKCLSVYPIHTDSVPFLCAVFPRTFKSNLLPLLRKNRHAIETVFVARKDAIHKLLTDVKKGLKGNGFWGAAGEFVGGVLKETVLKP